MYDEVLPLRKGVVIAESVHQDPDDPNTVIVYHQYADLSTAQEFLASLSNGENQAVLAKAGVQLDTLEMWIGENV